MYKQIYIHEIILGTRNYHRKFIQNLLTEKRKKKACTATD